MFLVFNIAMESLEMNDSITGLTGLNLAIYLWPLGIMKCSRCYSTDKLTKHHQYPVVHFGHKKDGLMLCLCQECHRKIENNILAVESHLGNLPFGVRYKLDRSDYDRITHNFLFGRQIIYVAVWHHFDTLPLSRGRVFFFFFICLYSSIMYFLGIYMVPFSNTIFLWVTQIRSFSFLYLILWL